MNCGYCKEKDFEVVKYSTTSFSQIMKAQFCPMCGEPLTEPKALTLEELKQMDGNPVFVEDLGYGIISKKFIRPYGQSFLISFPTGRNLLSEIFKIKKIYDYKPKED